MTRPHAAVSATAKPLIAAVFAFTLFSGIHYVFFVSRLINKSGADPGSSG